MTDVTNNKKEFFMTQQVNHYKISANFAKDKNLPTSFVGTVLKETDKAMFIYGHGEINPSGKCSRCGRTLTHEGSIIIGIGPECLGNYERRAKIKETITDEEKEYLQSLIKDQVIDCWIPKGVIKDWQSSDKQIQIPEDHPMIKQRSAQESQRKATQVRYKNSGKAAIKITFTFNQEDLQNVKTLEGRRFHNEGRSKYWTCPLNLENVEALQKWGFELDDNLLTFLDKAKTSINDVGENIEIPNLQGELFPYQKKGVNFIENKDGRALIGDEMGLGKTCQALAWLQLHPEKRPAVIVCPASLKLNWDKEARSWMTEPNIQILSGKKATTPIVGDVIIINYDILDSWLEVLKGINPQVLIMDECHFIKNNQAKRTKTTKSLAKNIPHVIALSGTPIINRPIEGYNALKLIDNRTVPSFWAFAKRYCGAAHNGFGWDFSGATNTDELHEKLTNTVMIRRLKKDVLTDLPDKIYGHVPMEINNRRNYNKAETNFTEYLQQTKGKEAAEKASNAEMLTKIGYLKQLAVAGKMKPAVEWIRNFIESNGKLVVFAEHKFVIDQLMEEFGNIAVKVDGSVSGVNREEAVDKFQNDDNIRLFVGNMQAAGVGITLTAASTVAFLELPWAPGQLTQAEDRCHRIGQKDSVNVYYLLAQDTIEEKIAELIDEKRKVLDQVLDGTETDDSSLLTELINTYE